MASTKIEDYLTCSICLEIFQDPSSLSCHHSFCRGCLENYWTQKKNRTCPLCKRKSSKESLWINFALKELSISFLEEQRAEEEDRVVCVRHPDVAPLFCREEEQAFCPICEVNPHKNHTLDSVEELKEQTESNLKRLKATKEAVIEEKNVHEEILLHSEKQEKDCERYIHSVFERLQQFLTNEREKALSHVREEKLRRTEIIDSELESVNQRLTSLSKSIQGLERQLQRGAVEFLTHYKPRQGQGKTQQTQRQPPQQGLLLNQAELLGNLGYRVWQRMKSVAQYAPVVLDPNTANRSLRLSDDLTRVGHGEDEGAEQEDAPSNPERFTNMAAVLGSDGFTSGAHQWDVEVGDHPHWVIGVAKESADKEEKTNISPEYGIWCLWHGNGGYTNGACNTFIPVEKRPAKIRVKLDVDKGKVSFYDAEDMTLLCVHKDKFKEKMYPVFSVGMAGEAETRALQICHSEAV